MIGSPDSGQEKAPAPLSHGGNTETADTLGQFDPEVEAEILVRLHRVEVALDRAIAALRANREGAVAP